MTDTKIPKRWLSKAQKLVNKILPQEMQMPAHKEVVEHIALLMMQNAALTTACEGIQSPAVIMPEVIRCLFDVRTLLGSNDDSIREVRIHTKNEEAQIKTGKLFYRIDEVLKFVTRPENN